MSDSNKIQWGAAHTAPGHDDFSCIVGTCPLGEVRLLWHSWRSNQLIWIHLPPPYENFRVHEHTFSDARVTAQMLVNHFTQHPSPIPVIPSGQEV